MVGTLPPRCLQALPHGTKNAATDGPGYRATPRSTTEPHTGLDVRHLPSPSPCGRGEVFSLDIPFYRTPPAYPQALSRNGYVAERREDGSGTSGPQIRKLVNDVFERQAFRSGRSSASVTGGCVSRKSYDRKAHLATVTRVLI